jgi:mannan endo-1,6-alpha-mannosidase
MRHFFSSSWTQHSNSAAAFNNGYNYKNSISNGCFFNIAARLAKYTGNDTYAQWADKTWNWLSQVGLLDENYYIYDGSDDTLNCSQINRLQWTYNAGVMLLGAATMYNYTNGDPTWKARVDGLLKGTDVFFSDGVLFEVACETNGKCDNDQMSFKAYLARWMAATTKQAPWTYDTVMSRLKPSAQAAAAQCNGAPTGRVCGIKWTDNGTWDGTSGPGQQMSALEVVQSCLISEVAGPLTNSTGGTSVGNPNAGSDSAINAVVETPATTGDKIGSGFLTAFVIVGMVGGALWISL